MASDKGKKTLVMTIVISLLIYAVMIGLHFDPEFRNRSAVLFGKAPLGLPVTAVVIVVETFLYLPMTIVWYHLVVLLRRAQEEGASAPRGTFSFLAFLVEAEKNFPDLKRSIYICVGGFFYCVAILIAFVVYTKN
jgi:hypothetical protein